MKAESGETELFLCQDSAVAATQLGTTEPGLGSDSYGPWAPCSRFTWAVWMCFSQERLLTCFAQADCDGNTRAVVHLQQGLNRKQGAPQLYCQISLQLRWRCYGNSATPHVRAKKKRETGFVTRSHFSCEGHFQ